MYPTSLLNSPSRHFYFSACNANLHSRAPHIVRKMCSRVNLPVHEKGIQSIQVHTFILLTTNLLMPWFVLVHFHKSYFLCEHNFIIATGYFISSSSACNRTSSLKIQFTILKHTFGPSRGLRLCMTMHWENHINFVVYARTTWFLSSPGRDKFFC